MSEGAFPQQPIRLVVSDVDGTLVTKDKRVTPRALEAIHALRARGVLFTIISARPPIGVHKLIDTLALPGPVCAVNGGAIIRRDLSVVERKFIDPVAAYTSVAFLRERGIDAWLFTENEWFLRDPQGAHVDHEKRTLGMGFIEVDDFSEDLYTRCLKIVGASHDHDHLARCEIDLQARLGTTASATRSQVYYLDITHAAAVKGNGLADLAHLLGLGPESVMALGDGTNDISMLERAGFSVAMGNASDTVKSAATVVTDDNEHEGLAKAIERYVLADPRTQNNEVPHLIEDTAGATLKA